MTSTFNHFLTKPNEKPHRTGSTKRICSQGLTCPHSSVGGADIVFLPLLLHRETQGVEVQLTLGPRALAPGLELSLLVCRFCVFLKSPTIQIQTCML